MRTATFQRIFNTPITVEGGNGFVLNAARIGNSHQTDAVVLDITLSPIPEPSSLGLLSLVGLCALRRRR